MATVLPAVMGSVATAGNPYNMLKSRFNGPDESTDFIDDTRRHTINAAGSAQLDTAQYVSAPSSLLLPANSYAYIDDSPDWDFGTGDFFIRWHARFNSVGYNAFIEHTGDSTANMWAISRQPDAGGRLLLYARAGNVTVMDVEVAFTPNTGQWYKLSFGRTSGVITVEIDDEAQELAVNYQPGAELSMSDQSLYIGRHVTGAFYHDGWIDDVLIRKGIGHE